MKALTLILTFCIIVAFSQASRIPSQLQNESPTLIKLNQTQLKDNFCGYALTIMISYRSPYYSRGRISLRFGNNEQEVFDQRTYYNLKSGTNQLKFEVNSRICVKPISYVCIYTNVKELTVKEVGVEGIDGDSFEANFQNFASGTWICDPQTTSEQLAYSSM